MVKSKSNIEPKSEHTLLNTPKRMKGEANTQQSDKLKLQWTLPTTQTQTQTTTPLFSQTTPTPWLNISNSNFSDFANQAAQHQQQ